LLAREALIADLTRGRQALRADALGFYESVLADPKVAIRDKVKAQERIDKLLGLEDKSNQPPLEVILGQLPTALADPLRRLLAERVSIGGSGPCGSADVGLDGHA
jgi:hypothetical protein